MINKQSEMSARQLYARMGFTNRFFCNWSGNHIDGSEAFKQGVDWDRVAGSDDYLISSAMASHLSRGRL